MLETIVKSNNNNRIPIVIASEQAAFNLKSLEQIVSGNRKCSVFDLRKAFMLKDEEKYNYKQEFSEMTKNTIK